MSQAYAQLIMFNEGEYQRLPAKKRPVFVYDWLKNFEESLGIVSKVSKHVTVQLVEQIWKRCGGLLTLNHESLAVLVIIIL